MISHAYEFIHENHYSYIIALVWGIVGIAIGELAIFFIGATVLYLLQRERYLELFFGFIFILAIANSREDMLQFAKPAREIYTVLLVLPLLLSTRMTKDIRLVYYFIPFFAIGLGTLIISHDPLLSFLKLFSYFLILLVVPVYVKYLYEEYGDSFLKNLFYFTIFLLLAGFLVHLFDTDISTLNGRFRGIFGNPNGLSTFILLSVILMEIVRYAKPDLIPQYERNGVLVLVAVALLMSGSRTGMVTVALFYTLIYLFTISRLLGFSFVLLIGILHQQFLLYLPDVITFLNLGEFLRVDNLDQAGGRFIAFEFAWEQIQSSFWIGNGFAYNEYLFTEYADTLSALGHQGGTHNAYLSIWLDTGLIGLLFFVGAWVLLFWKTSRVSDIALPFALAVAFSSYFEGWLASSLNHVTIIAIINITLLYVTGFEWDSIYEED